MMHAYNALSNRFIRPFISSISVPNHIAGFDYLRGFAAFVVVIHHIVGMLTGETRATHHFWVGAAGVDIFFVLSGFLMFGFLAEARPPVQFWIRRLLRVFPSYFLFTTFAFLVNILILKRDVHFQIWHYTLSLLFIPHINQLGDLKPIVGAGWSLVYEFWFYTFIMICLFFRRYRLLIFIAPLFILPVIDYSNKNIAHQFLGNNVIFEFWLGALSRAVLCISIKKSYSILMLITGLGVLCADQFLHLDRDMNRLFIWGIPALLIVTSISHMNMASTSVGRFLGDTSYAVYLAHPIFIIGAQRFFLKGNPSLIGSAICIGAIVLLTYMTAFFVHKYVDIVATNKLKKIIFKNRQNTPLNQYYPAPND